MTSRLGNLISEKKSLSLPSNEGSRLEAKLHQGQDGNLEFQKRNLGDSGIPFGVINEGASSYIEARVSAFNVGSAAGPSIGAFSNLLIEKLQAAGLVSPEHPVLINAVNTSEILAGDTHGEETGSVSAADAVTFSGAENILQNHPYFPSSSSGADTYVSSAAQGGGSGGGGLATDPQPPDNGDSDPDPNPPDGGDDDDGDDDPSQLVAPQISISPLAGEENQPLPLAIGINAQPGTQTHINITGLPVGATLSAGINNGNGSWNVSLDEIDGLALNLQPYQSGTFTLGVTAVSTDGTASAQSTANLPIDIEGVATAPTLSTQAASGVEDSAITLHIGAALVDTDGSETLSVTVSGVPIGAILSQGHNNNDGSWTLTPGQLANLVLTPPPHFSGDVNLTITATSSENGTTASTVAGLPVSIAGLANLPVLSVQQANGVEDTAIALNISAALADTDGSETLNIIISGVPAGATLSAGTDNGGGSWTLTAAQLAGLTFTPPLHASGTYALNVSAVASEGNTSVAASAPLNVNVAGAATAPLLSVAPVAGTEDTAIALNISAALVDTDGSESLSITVANMPAGAVLSAGINNGNGSWTLTPAQLNGLTFTPPLHASGNYSLTVTATSSENGTQTSTAAQLGVAVAGAATAPILSVGVASGSENVPVPLSINAALADTDGSETLSITISGVPNDVILSAGQNNGDGTWTLTPQQLVNLTLSTPANWSGHLDLTVTAASSENGLTAQTVAALPVDIAGVANVPTLATQPANGAEDAAIALHIHSALTDTDGSETLSITIGNVPSGALLSTGHDNGDGTWTLTPAQLSGLTITPPPHFSGTINLTVTSTASEGGSFAHAMAGLAVTVNGVATTPSLSLANVGGLEDSAIALNINAALADTDGSEVLAVTISGVPINATLSAGTNNGGGSWTLNAAQLSGLTLTPPANFSGAINLHVTATSAENGTQASAAADMTVTVAGVADAPALSVQPASGDHDTPIALDISAALMDTDGSETLYVIVSNLPAGATLSAGTHNPDGSWTLNAAQLPGLTISPPANWSGDFNLRVTATAAENATTASTTSFLPVVVNGDAPVPQLSVSDSSGNEDTAIALDIDVTLDDVDGSEVLLIDVSGAPYGTLLSAGTDNGDCTWTLTPVELVGLTLTPPANWSGEINLIVTATANDNGVITSTMTSLQVDVAGVADAPTLNVQPAIGNEDSAIALNIGAALTDTDGSESLSITVAGVPAGAMLSAGHNNNDGTWTLTSAQLTNLTFTPPAGFSGAIDLDITATASEDGTSTSSNASLHMTINSVVDAPSLSVQGASGAEDTAIALTINAALTDTDGSETLSILITNVPVGATLSAGTNNGQDGNWTLTAAQLSGLTITPPPNFSGSFNLGVTATSTENAANASASASVTVNVSAVADTPNLSVQSASGAEDMAIALNISASLADTDGSESLSITVAGVPAGAMLSAGTNNGNGSWTLTAAQLSGLTFTPAAHASGTVNLTVTATASENGTSASASTNLSVVVAGAATAPLLNVANASGIEDTNIALNISAAIADTDGSETLSITIANMPAGATLSAGTNNGNGTWTLTAAQLSGLTFTPPVHASGNYTLNITATSSENGTTATTTANLGVAIAGAADAPLLNIANVSGIEDTAIALNIGASLVDMDGSETLSITVSGVPAGATLSAGTNNGNGTWTLTPQQLANLTFTPPAHASGSYALTITATSSENGTTASAQGTLNVGVSGAATTPSLSVSAASGNEDTAIALNITPALVDTDGSESLSITISGVPLGAVLSAGTNNGGGSWTLTPAQLSGLTIVPPSNFSGIFNLSVTATSSENATTATANATLPVTVLGVADIPSLSLHAVSGNEDGAIALGISASLNDADGSETLSVRITGVPAGATLSAGTNNGGGIWTLTAAQLSGLTLTPPANFSGSFNLSVTATASENNTSASIVGTLPVSVAGDADAPSLSVHAVSGAEDTAVALGITAALNDTDGSEALSVTIAGVPAGATLSAGTNNGNGTWTLTAAQLSGLTFTPPSHASGLYNLSVTAIASENGTSASTNFTLPVTINGVATIPALTTQRVSGNEDTAIALNIGAALNDTDGSETLSLTIAGVPAGAVLSAGTNNGGGSWTLNAAQLSGLTLTPPSNFSGAFSLTVTAMAVEGNTWASNSAPLPVTVRGIADTPVLSVANASGNEDTAIALNITTALTDTDGSESLSVLVTGVPSGALLSAGLYDGNGRWSLTPAQLSGLTITPASNFSGVMNLTVKAIATESDGSSTSLSSPLTVTVAAQADAQSLTISSASGQEDTQISLNVASALADLDGSEVLSITIADIPTGATLSAGTNNGGGSWTLTAAQLANLKITPSANSDADFTLTVTAKSTDGASIATTSGTLAVSVLGNADTPNVSASNSAVAINTQAPVTVSGSLGADTDGSESLTYFISGVPDGFSLSAGSNNGNNTWTLTPSQLANLTMISPYNFQGRVYMTAQSVSHDGDGSTAMSTAAAFNISVGNASALTLNLGAGIGLLGIGNSMAAGVTVNTGGLLTAGGIVMREDSTMPLTDATSLLSLTAGINLLSFSGLPPTASLSAGTKNPDGSWSLLPGQLTGLNLILPPNSDEDFTIGIGARVTVLGITTTITLATTVVHVLGVADAPTLNVADATGNEDAAAIPISVTSALVDTDGSETLSIMIKDLPAGFTPTVGTNNGNGTWTIPVASLSSLAIKPPANWSGDATFTVIATSTEREGDSMITTATGHIHVNAVADAPLITAMTQSGTEDTNLALNFGISLRDTDGSESISALTVWGIPAGATLTNATNNHDGTWSITPANINNVHLVPAANWSGTATLSITATSQEGINGPTASTTAQIPLHIAAVADTPLASASDSSGTAGAAIGLNLGAALTDADGSERLSAVISGVPDGVHLSAGLHNADGSWTLTAAQLSNVTLTAPTSFAGDLHLALDVFAQESSNANAATTHQDFTVHVSAASNSNNDLDHTFQTGTFG